MHLQQFIEEDVDHSINSSCVLLPDDDDTKDCHTFAYGIPITVELQEIETKDNMSKKPRFFVGEIVTQWQEKEAAWSCLQNEEKTLLNEHLEEDFGGFEDTNSILSSINLGCLE